MKKNLAKKVTLSILAGAILMSSSVAWAESKTYTLDGGTVDSSISGGIAIGAASVCNANNSVVIGAAANCNDAKCEQSVVIGFNGGVSEKKYGVALGAYACVEGANSVALGYGSKAYDTDVVSVGSGSTSANSDAPATRSIINVKDIPAGKLTAENDGKYTYGSYAVNVNTLNNALAGYVKKEAMNDGSSTTNVTDTFNVVETIVDTNTETKTTTVTINATDEDKIVMDKDGITVGQNSARIDGSGFYVWDGGDHTAENAKASMTKDGKIKAANGAFIVNESGNVTAQDVTANNFIIKGANSSDINIGTKLGELDSKVQTNTTTIATKADRSYVDNELGKKANASDVYTKDESDSLLDAKANKDDVYNKTEIDTLLNNNNADAIAGINQRLDKTNAKINKVGAGAAALAALHPLEYDPDDKLTFSAGVGNYAGENAAALGAFYRPNEKFMLSLGGTMGNGENMVNLGLSIGLDKPNGFAKMSKRELIQEVNAVKAENEAMKAEMAEMKAMLQELLAKK